MDERLRCLKEKLLQELTPAEKWFFLKTAKELIQQGYPATENLFYYCYFLSLENRMNQLLQFCQGGLTRYLFAHTMANLKDSLRRYKEKIQQERRRCRKPQWCPPSEWPPAIT